MKRTGPALADSIREAMRSLLRARLRTVLGLTGIMIGIASVIAMISTGEIATAESRRQYEAFGTDIVRVNVRGDQDTPGLALQDALTVADTVSSIVVAAPILPVGASMVYEGRQLEGSIRGTTGSLANLYVLELADGRFVSDLDIRQFWCVIDATTAGEIRRRGAETVVGGKLEIGGHFFTVAGELRETIAVADGLTNVDSDSVVYIPVTTAQRMRPGADIKTIVARTAPGVFHEDATAELTDWLRQRLGRSTRFQVDSAEQLIAQMESQLGLMTVLIGAVGSISLIVGGIGVMNIMLISVAERRREIGVRRALGASRSAIQRQFLIETVILTVAGGIAGTAFGTAAVWAICRFTGWEFFVSELSIAVGLGVSSAVGVFFGFQPAYQASRLDPIVALQGE